MDKIERDILKNSEFIIEYYKNNGKKLTNLELQKLMYFLEAIYMVCTDDDYLFKEPFSAWNLGPVNMEIYQKYKDFGSMPIELENHVNINLINLKYIKNLYDLFKDYTATQLVNLSHLEGSPWYNICIYYNYEIPHHVIIDKKETKNWFKTLVELGDDDGKQ